MLGIQMAFVGLFGAVLQPFTSVLTSLPDGWRYSYFIIGGLTFVVVIAAAILLLRNKPEDKGLLPYGAEIEDGGTGAEVKVSNQAAIEISEKEAIHSASLFLLLFFMIAITGVGVFTQHIPTFGERED